MNEIDWRAQHRQNRESYKVTMQNHFQRRAVGFTLVELLVVIAIIGVLVALLLPAVQAARESARRNACTNNLRQIGLAVQNYHDAMGRYPMGRDGIDQYSIAWSFRLLPFMEQQQIYEAWQVGARVDDDVNARAMRTPVSTYYCPSRRPPAADRDFDNHGMASIVRAAAAGGDYAANAGRDVRYGMSLGLAGGTLDLARAGPIFSFSQIRAAQIRDGTSQTIAVGEKHIPPPDEDCVAGFEHKCLGDMAFFAGDDTDTIFGEDMARGPMDGSDDEFGSEHPDITQFVFLDGHVDSIRYGVDNDAFELLLSIGDGEVVDTNNL